MAFVFRYHFKGMILVLDTFHLFLTGLRETLADDDPAFRAFFEMHVSLNVTMAVAPGDCLILFLSRVKPWNGKIGPAAANRTVKMRDPPVHDRLGETDIGGGEGDHFCQGNPFFLVQNRVKGRHLIRLQLPQLFIDQRQQQGRRLRVFWKAVNVILGRSKTPSEDSSSEKSLSHKVLNENIDLYMDMQGGDRNTISQMNAIVELLSRQGVTVKGRYANDFIPNRTPPLHTIREASEEYRTYDLISAMDAFSRYGWGDSLDEFFHGRVRGSSKESKLIKAIKQASSAISKCNADGFDSAVQKIEKLKSEFKESEHVTQMDVVFQDIQDDYSPLFGAKYRYVAQIRWCLDKNSCSRH